MESATIGAGLEIEPEFVEIVIKSRVRKAKIMSTTRKINLRNARIEGVVVLPKQAIDVSGTDLSQADSLELLDVSDYYSWPDFRGLVEDETTKWPTPESPDPKL